MMKKNKCENIAKHSVVSFGRTTAPRIVNGCERWMSNGRDCGSSGWNRRPKSGENYNHFFPQFTAKVSPERKIKLLSWSTQCLHIIISLHSVSFHFILLFFSLRHSLFKLTFGCSVLADVHSMWCTRILCFDDVAALFGGSVDATKRFGNNSFASLSFIFHYCFPSPFFSCTFTRFDALFFILFLADALAHSSCSCEWVCLQNKWSCRIEKLCSPWLRAPGWCPSNTLSDWHDGGGNSK